MMYANKLKEISKFIEPLKKFVKVNAKLRGTKKKDSTVGSSKSMRRCLFPDSVNNAVTGPPPMWEVVKNIITYSLLVFSHQTKGTFSH